MAAWVSMPLAPVTVIVDVVCGTAKPVPEQPVKAAHSPPMKTKKNSIRTEESCLRARLILASPNARSSVAKAMGGAVGWRLAGMLRLSLLKAGMVTVMTLEAVAALGVTLAGAKDAVAPAGRPETVKVTALLNGLVPTRGATAS